MTAGAIGRDASRAEKLDRIVAAMDRLAHRFQSAHEAAFLEIDLTMPQAKALYAVDAAGEIHMADLVRRFGVSLSTMSGLVDRLVDHGLLARRDDPADRRQVIVSTTEAGRDLAGRLREYSSRMARQFLERLSDADLGVIEHALGVLSGAASPPTFPDAPPAQPQPSSEDPS